MAGRPGPRVNRCRDRSSDLVLQGRNIVMNFRRIVIVLALVAFPGSARAIEVGDKATDFSVEDANGKTYTLASFTKKVLVVWYEGKNSKEQNRWIKDKLKDLRNAGTLDAKRYESFGFANFQETAVPNALIQMVIKSEIKKTGAVILCDKTGKMMTHWGFRNGRSNIYVFNQDRRLLWKTSGPLDQKRGNQLIRFIMRLVRE
jgi:predicted transcriptional regulator